MKDKDIKLLKESIKHYDRMIEFAEEYKGDFYDFEASMDDTINEDWDAAHCCLCKNYYDLTCIGCPYFEKYGVKCFKSVWMKMNDADNMKDWLKYAKEMREQIRACLPQKIEKLKHVAQSEVRCKINEIIDHINTTTVDKSEISTKGDKQESHDKCDKQEVSFHVGGLYENLWSSDNDMRFIDSHAGGFQAYKITNCGLICVNDFDNQEEVNKYINHYSGDKIHYKYIGQLSDYLKGLKSEKSL
jgi:hypothetical protein